MLLFIHAEEKKKKKKKNTNVNPKRESKHSLKYLFGSTFTLSVFFFFSSHIFFFLRQITLFTVLFTGPTVTLFRKNTKNGSRGTIYTFKNYFATVFSVFSFSKKKLYPNGS